MCMCSGKAQEVYCKAQRIRPLETAAVFKDVGRDWPGRDLHRGGSRHMSYGVLIILSPTAPPPSPSAETTLLICALHAAAVTGGRTVGLRPP